MKTVDTPISGVHVVGTTVHADSRGWFCRAFCEDELTPILHGLRIRQANLSHTLKSGTVRGLHYQRKPYAETKLVRCLSGRVWDVALDLRKGSPTFLRWFGQELSPENGQMMVIPEGCAHGFQALEPNSQLLYLHTATYNAAAESGVRYSDAAGAIKWPVTVTEVSERDLNFPILDQDFCGLE